MTGTVPAHPPVDETRRRWVVAAVGTTPLEGRVIGWRDSADAAAELAAGLTGGPFEILEIHGPDTVLYPLPGEGPTYWQSLHPTDRLVGTVVDGIEVYEFAPNTFVVVDDTGPGSPEPLGAIYGIGPRPGWPDDLGIDENDPAWIPAADADNTWAEAVRDSSLAVTLNRCGADRGWALVELFRPAGYDPRTGDGLAAWLAETVLALVANSAD